METRKESLSALKVCRFCLTRNQPLRSLYEKSNRDFGDRSIPLSMKILSCLSVEVFPSDKMPSFICNRCKFFMDLCYQYKSLCRGADEAILKYVQIGTPLDPAEWSVKLSKIHLYGNRIPKVNSMQTVVEGGATVEVMQNDGSDSDCDEEENVYNVKVGDGDNADSTFVKVVTANNSNANKKGSVESDVKCQSNVCWACDECDRTYPLQQLLELHKVQKHRERSVSCDQCDAVFFTKYDMSKHKVRHTDETPFQCKLCDKRFKVTVLLKRHEKLVHPELLHNTCPYCPATFYSESSMNEHVMSQHNEEHSPTVRCPECHKKVEIKKLQNHIKVVHCQPLDHCCEYCPERFSSVTKLTRHVRTHAGIRPYPCKYCNKSFIKSHHYTRHLRQKHADVRGTNNQEMYRCEQCEETFSSQDNLIYHSAIHATQNLICPLCQEKFADVDAVTTHIKSHVTGMEFMCDYCELVFTSKEKLDSHHMTVHGDEISELGQNNSSMDCEGEEDEDDSEINVKEDEDQFVLEIKKPDNYMIKPTIRVTDEQQDNTCSEESEPEATYMELMTVDTLADVKPPAGVPVTLPVLAPAPVTVINAAEAPAKPPIYVTMEVVEGPGPDQKIDIQTAKVSRKVEEVKRKKAQPTPELNTSSQEKKPVKPETTSGASDKSLKLLEKELQELKRTTRTDTPKTPAKPEFVRTRGRPPLHTSTPKPRVEEKKLAVVQKMPALEKKMPERRAIKENKELKDGKEKSLSKDDKDKTVAKDDKEVKEAEPTKAVVKNGSSVKSANEDGVRRSTRPSKIKDYAKMIRDKSQQSDNDDDSDDGDEEYVETPTQETRPKTRRGSLKVTPKPIKTMPAAAKKRGRSRKEPAAEVPSKMKKGECDEDEDIQSEKIDTDDTKEKSSKKDITLKSAPNTPEISRPNPEPKPQILMSPSGQTLKKVPVKSLPPGVKPMPLPHPLQISEMQIGKKMVKVQKIVMTKAEVEAMAKKGLVEMKDGTIMLKQGIKIPSDPGAIKSTLVGEDINKESPAKKEKAAPTRCDLTES